MRMSVAILTLLGIITYLAAQEPAATKSQRTFATLRGGDAAALADVLAKHFKGDAEILAVPGGGGLLINAAPAVTQEVLALLTKLDRAPRAVEVEVMLVEVQAKKGAFEKGAEAEFTGPAAEVLAKLEALGKVSQLGLVNRIKVTSAEGQQATVITGGNKPVAMGATIGGKGIASKSYTYMPVGTTAKVTPRIVGEDTAVIDLDLKEHRIKTAEPGAAGADDPAETTSTTLTSKVTVPAGRAVAVQAVRTAGKGGDTLAVVVVVARILP